MGPQENNSKSKEADVKVKTDQVNPQTHHLWKTLASIPQPNFSKACRSLTGNTFSGNNPYHFKATLDNIAIYAGSNYGHNIETNLKSQKEPVMPQPETPKDNASESTKYIFNIYPNNYIVCRYKLKQDPKPLFLMLIVHCNDGLKTKHQKRNDFRALKDGGSVLKIIDAIKEERYGLLRSD